MTSRSVILLLFVILTALLLAACLGEPALPALESVPAATLAAPSVDPTVAAAPRHILNLESQISVSDQPIPQIRHDMIGRSDCLMCHKQSVSGAPRIPDAHRGLENNTCQTCHSAPTSAGLSGEEMYARVCARCHGENGEGGVGLAFNTKTYLRNATDEDIRAAIVRGRGTAEMLAWGDLGLLTERQIDELVAMIRTWEPDAPEDVGPAVAEPADAAHGNPEGGEVLFAQFCSGCHGLNGETSVGDEFILREQINSQNDATIARGIRDGGQGMPSFHALLITEEINDLLALMRSWQAGPNPTPTPIALSGEEVFARVCARCHGLEGEGGIGPSFQDSQFQTTRTDTQLFNAINLGHEATAMIGWGDILSAEQIEQLVALIRVFRSSGLTTEPGPGEISFAADVMPIFEAECVICHGSFGGWDGNSYEAVMTSGNNAPVVIPGDAENSLLAQKMLGTQTIGDIMPPGGLLAEDEVQVILDWIDAGALDN
jgi:mono/diheme cytochrome c family protein